VAPHQPRRTRRRIVALTVSGATLAAVGLGNAAGALADPTVPQTFFVTNTANSGTGSLRDAINLANANPGPDTIDFSIADGGAQTITLTTAEDADHVLPTITSPVAINGYTQDPNVAYPIRIEVGVSAGVASLIDVGAGAAGGSTAINGLSISATSSGAFGWGVRVKPGADNVLVNDNQIGLTPAGDAESDGTIVGGVLAEASAANIINNVIAGVTYGIKVDPGSSALIGSNRVGISRDSSTALAVQQGIVLDGATGSNVYSNQVVGTTSSYSGISVDGGFGNIIDGNLVGAGTFTAPVGRSGGGIVVSTNSGGVTDLEVTNNEVYNGSGDGIVLTGGTNGIGGYASGNYVSDNAGSGIRATGTVLGQLELAGNTIFDNGALGIDTGPAGVNSPPDGPPTITSAAAGASTVDIAYDGPTGAQPARLWLSTNSTCDSTTQGETRYRYGTLDLDENGDFTGAVTLSDQVSAGDNLTAVISPSTGLTTEYSACFQVTDTAIGHEPLTLGATPDPASLGLGESVDITLQGYDEDGDPLTFGLPGAGSSINGNSVQLIGSPQCDGNTPSICSQVARYSASTAYVGADVFTWNVSDATRTAPAASATVNVVDADLDVVQAYPVGLTFTTGDQVIFQAAVINRGPDDAANTVITFTGLPAGTTFVSGTSQDGVNQGSTPCSEAGGVITCPVGNVTPTLATAEIVLQTSAQTPDSFDMTASASSDTPDGNSANDQRTSAAVTRAATGDADLSVSTLVDSPDPVTAGGVVQYTTTVTNNGPGDATGVQVKLFGDSSASLPAFTSFVSGNAGSATCSSTSGGPVLCPVGGLASGDSISVTIYLQTDGVSSVTTTPVEVSVTSSSTDPNPGNGSSSTSTTINPATGGDTSVFVPPSDQTQTVASAPTVTFGGTQVPVATPGDTTAAAVTVPPNGPGGVVEVEEQQCQTPFVCPTTAALLTNNPGRPPGALINDVVVRFLPPTDPFYDYTNPHTYQVLYDASTVVGVARSSVRIFYVKDDAPTTLVRARACPTPLTSSTVFPCVRGKSFLKSQKPSIAGDLRVRILATYNDPKIGTYKG
jgi:uncharacterized repeat protein (TIGR01451 family)